MTSVYILSSKDNPLKSFFCIFKNSFTFRNFFSNYYLKPLGMIHVDLVHNKAHHWSSSDGVFVKGKCFDQHEKLISGKQLIEYFKDITTEKDFKERLQGLNGLFAVVINIGNKVFASVDRLRNFPLLYELDNKQLTILDDFRVFCRLKKREINASAAEGMRSFGYVLKDETLLKNVFQLRASEYLVFENNLIKTGYIYKVDSLSMIKADKSHWKNLLRKSLFEVGERLSTSIGNSPVALPLSGGFDSRLIGLLLKINGHKNVLCFTYGDVNNAESRRSKEVAQRLEYPWMMIDYAPYIGEDYINTPAFSAYIDFVGNATSFPYISEYFAARYLKEQYGLPKETIIIPGHSGDMLGGSHLFPDMSHFNSKRTFAKKVCRTNGKLIPLSSTQQRDFWDDISTAAHTESISYSHLLHDNWNITERQSKQIVNSSRVWNYFGYEYVLPFWDNKLTELLLSFPFEFRLNKNLYHEVLEELFIENGILFPKESTASFINHRKQMYLRRKIKEYFPFLTKLKSNKFVFDFFYFEELLAPMLSELRSFEYNDGNAVLSAWYIDQVKNSL